MDVLAFLTLDIQRPNISAIVYGMQGDRQSRAIRAQLADGSTQWTPPAGTFFVISYAKPDGTHGMYSQTETGNAAVTVSGSVATIELAEQVLTVAGDVPMTLTMFNADGERLSAFTWLLIVKPAAYSDAAFMSTDYYNLLTEQIAAVLKAKESMAGLTATATTLAPGSEATVTVTGGTGADDPFNFEIGIPRGNTGARGATGAPAEITAQIVEYQSGTSGTTAPTGAWSTTVPSVPAGQYLWTRSTVTFNSGSPVVSYSVSRMGVDGTGAVKSVNNQFPDGSGNVTVTASDIQMSDNRSVEEAIESAGAVNSVNHIYPDSSKDVSITSDNIPTPSHSSITAALASKANVADVSNPNLLDNPWFTVNQRGQTSYTGNNMYTVDRWICEASRLTVSISNDGVTLSNSHTTARVSLQQLFPKDHLEPGEYTISVKFSDGVIKSGAITIPDSATYSIDYNFDGNTLRVMKTENFIIVMYVIRANDADTIRAMKLEYGSVSTLANDHAPDYATELLKCQRFYYALQNKTELSIAGYAQSTTVARFHIVLPTIMRQIPALQFDNLSSWRIYPANAQIESISNVGLSGNEVVFVCNSSGLTANSIVALKCQSALSISADM